ncbi:MAG: tellurite resistance protein [Bradymonadia bacterium]|jgi:tellurite resistance protein
MSDLQKFAERYDGDIDRLRTYVIEAMVLGAVADGELDRRESESIIQMIASHAQFTGIGRDALRSDLERAFEAIVSEGFHVRLHALAAALPNYPHRVLAFRAAVVVAFANGRLDDDEFTFLRQMQKVLGIAESDVQRAFEDAQLESAPSIPTDIEPVEAYLDCLLMAAAADGEIRDEELATIIAFVLSREEFDGLDEDQLRNYINGRLRAFASGATEERLEDLHAEFNSVEQRENAYGLALAMAFSDGDLAAEERRFLINLRMALDLQASQVADVEAFDED